MSEERLIKKYANRRLYDAAQSRHIKLGDVRDLVIAGSRFKVIEDQTKRDITRLILLQVIADQEQSGSPLFTTPLLQALIRCYGSSLQSLLGSYLEASVTSFMCQQDLVQAQIAGGTSTSRLLAELARRNLQRWSEIQQGSPGTLTSAPPPETATQARAEPFARAKA